MLHFNPTHFNPVPVVLENNLIRLLPLQLDHTDDLFHAGMDDSIWNYLPCPRQKTLEETSSWIRDALQAQEFGSEIPFAIFHKPLRRIIGSTRYLDIRRNDRALEIGWSWLASAFHGTGTNAICKLLLMQHAFEELGAIRVQLKTDLRNHRSQKAMEKLGFVREGILRKSRLCWDEHFRDTVYYSVLSEEWPNVKNRISEVISQSNSSLPRSS